MPISDSYQDYLISRLKNPSYSAGYIEAFFDEKEPETELLKLVLGNVAEALCQERMTPEEARNHLEKLDELLSEKGNDAIYHLGIWLKVLGLKITVSVVQQPPESLETSPQPQEVLV